MGRTKSCAFGEVVILELVVLDKNSYNTYKQINPRPKSRNKQKNIATKNKQRDNTYREKSIEGANLGNDAPVDTSGIHRRTSLTQALIIGNLSISSKVGNLPASPRIASRSLRARDTNEGPAAMAVMKTFRVARVVSDPPSITFNAIVRWSPLVTQSGQPCREKDTNLRARRNDISEWGGTCIYGAGIAGGGVGGPANIASFSVNPYSSRFLYK